MKSFEHPIYMNNAATSWPKPPQVAEAVFEALSTMPGETNRGGVADFDVFEEVRTELAFWGLMLLVRLLWGPTLPGG